MSDEERQLCLGTIAEAAIRHLIPTFLSDTAVLCYLFVAGWGSGLDMLRASNYSSQHCQTIKCFIIKCASEEEMKCIFASLTCTNTLLFIYLFILRGQLSPLPALLGKLDKSCQIIVSPCMPLSFYFFFDWYFSSVYYNTCIPHVSYVFIFRCVWQWYRYCLGDAEFNFTSLLFWFLFHYL